MARQKVGLDLDGTLLDSRHRHGAALERAAANLEIQLTAELIDEYVARKSTGMSGLQVLTNEGIDRATELSQEWVRVIEHEDLLADDTLYPGVENVLHSYTERGLQFVLATSRQHPELAKRQLARLGLYTFLEDVFVAVANCGDRKSDLTSDLNIQAIVGDTEVDLQWATELGVPFYAVNYGFRSEAFWSDSQQRSWPTLGEALEQICADLLVD